MKYLLVLLLWTVTSHAGILDYAQAFQPKPQSVQIFGDGNEPQAAIDLRKKYGGKKVTFTGKVQSVMVASLTILGTTPATLLVKMDSLNMEVDLKDSETAKAQRLHKGAAVTFTGILQKKGILCVQNAQID